MRQKHRNMLPGFFHDNENETKVLKIVQAFREEYKRMDEQLTKYETVALKWLILHHAIHTMTIFLPQSSQRQSQSAQEVKNSDLCETFASLAVKKHPLLCYSLQNIRKFSKPLIATLRNFASPIRCGIAGPISPPKICFVPYSSCKSKA